MKNKKFVHIFPVTFLISLLLAYQSVSAAAFSDVSADEMYFAGIEFLVSEGIVNGYPDGTYKPANTLNRAEMMKIIAEGVAIYNNWPATTFDEYASRKCFEDVPSGQWFTKYICYGKDKGWVAGYENGRFYRPTQTVTFVEGLKITLQGFGITYTDDADIWYRPIVRRASQDNFIPFDIMAFNSGFKRNQMADLVARIIKFKEGKLAEYLGSRANIVVSYESIEAGNDLTLLETVELSPGENEPAVTGDLQFHTVSITDTNFVPSTLTIKKGETVRFLSTGTVMRWPASDVHPSHTVYPGSALNKCGTTAKNEIFDACKGIESGDFWEFTFNEIGSWNYHDHLSPSLGGTIKVE